ncbi:MAG: winged helix-turn-helix transcriptional regulator [Muribaculaceae bacterium]|nr:winged helix-turn-helix transcriptional regulator [Muribaculaceae bacterium]
MSEFDEYIVHGEPGQKEKADTWQTATIQRTTEVSPKSNICTLEETAVLRCIETNPKMTQKEMAATIRKSERTVKTLTSNLVDKGIIIRRNGRRNGWWKTSV